VALYIHRTLFPLLSIGTAYSTGYGAANSIIVWRSRELNRAEISTFRLFVGPLRASQADWFIYMLRTVFHNIHSSVTMRSVMQN
jgi:hypothetical protein